MRNRLNASAHTRVSDTTAGVFVNSVPQKQPQGSAPASPTQRFRITQVFGDYLTCQTFNDGLMGGVDIFVAKPYVIRRSTWNNVTRAGISYVGNQSDGQLRTATHLGLAPASARSEEVLDPAYILNDQIVATQPTGGTGVLAANGSAVIWEDLSARIFLPPHRVIQVCDNGIWKYQVVRAGTPYRAV